MKEMDIKSEIGIQMYELLGGCFRFGFKTFDPQLKGNHNKYFCTTSSLSFGCFF